MRIFNHENNLLFKKTKTIINIFLFFLNFLQIIQYLVFTNFSLSIRLESQSKVAVEMVMMNEVWDISERASGNKWMKDARDEECDMPTWRKLPRKILRRYSRSWGHFIMALRGHTGNYCRVQTQFTICPYSRLESSGLSLVNYDKPTH